MLKILTGILFFFITTNQSNGQSYITAFGPRINNTIGFSLQQKIANRTTTELIIQSNKKLVNPGIAILFEQHFPLITRRLNTYLGPGAHYYYDEVEDTKAYVENKFGISLIFGLELRVSRLCLAYDIMPLMNFYDKKTKITSSTGLSLRYILIKPKKQKFNFKNIFKKKNN